MNICINNIHTWLNRHPKAKQWLWFVILWVGGLTTVLVIAYPIKWVIKSM